MNSPDPDRDDPFGVEPPGPDLEAAEYALGVQDGDQRRRTQRRIAADAAFARRVSAWEDRLAGLYGEMRPLEPPTHVWPGVRRRLGWAAVTSARRGVWQSVGFWRAAAAAALVATGLLAVLTTVRQPPAPAPVAQAVTILSLEDGSPGYLATLDAGTGALQLVPVPREPDGGGRVPELWLIPPGEAPRSLGLVSTQEARRVVVPANLRRALTAGSALAVSLEPPGGAPQGAPTGPIVAQGAITSI
jgi:anti-sigma-K factor RskA